MNSSRRVMRDLQTQSDQNDTVSELSMIEFLLKITGSIAMELVPGNTLNLDKKTYDWKLIDFSEESLDL